MSDETENTKTKGPDRVAQLAGVVVGVVLGAYVANRAVAENDNSWFGAAIMFLLIGVPVGLLAVKFVEAGRAFLSGELIEDWERVARQQGKIQDARRARIEAQQAAARAAKDAAAAAPARAPVPAGETAPVPAPTPAPAAEAAPPPVSAAEAPAEQVGVRPPGLDEPRGGERDDLKRMKGVGPKVEAWLNSQGFWHYDQIAAWDAEHVAWADANLEGVKGRASRDDWVGQAKALVEGRA